MSFRQFLRGIDVHWQTCMSRFVLCSLAADEAGDEAASWSHAARILILRFPQLDTCIIIIIQVQLLPP
jgi:hypothetical protein